MNGFARQLCIQRVHIHAGAAQSTTDSTFFTTAENTEASSKFSARERIKTGRVLN